MKVKVTSKQIHGDVNQKIMELSGENIFACYQCGNCSATCPMAEEMELLPNQIFKHLQLGMSDFVLKANTSLMCASCFSCTFRCPQSLDLAKVNEAIRLLSLRKNVDLFDISSISDEDLEELPAIALISNFRKTTA